MAPARTLWALVMVLGLAPLCAAAETPPPAIPLLTYDQIFQFKRSLGKD